jgi:hypothetical protein
MKPPLTWELDLNKQQLLKMKSSTIGHSEYTVVPSLLAHLTQVECSHNTLYPFNMIQNDWSRRLLINYTVLFPTTLNHFQLIMCWLSVYSGRALTVICSTSCVFSLDTKFKGSEFCKQECFPTCCEFIAIFLRIHSLFSLSWGTHKQCTLGATLPR